MFFYFYLQQPKPFYSELTETNNISQKMHLEMKHLPKKNWNMELNVGGATVRQRSYHIVYIPYVYADNHRLTLDRVKKKRNTKKKSRKNYGRRCYQKIK